MQHQQSALFHEGINDAVGGAVQALGGTKKVASELWPSLKPETANARLRACLNDDRPDKLAPEELLWIAKKARESGVHTILDFICDECSYERAIPRNPLDRQAELLRELIDVETRGNRLREKLLANGGVAVMRSVGK